MGSSSARAMMSPLVMSRLWSMAHIAPTFGAKVWCSEGGQGSEEDAKGFLDDDPGLGAVDVKTGLHSSPLWLMAGGEGDESNWCVCARVSPIPHDAMVW